MRRRGFFAALVAVAAAPMVAFEGRAPELQGPLLLDEDPVPFPDLECGVVPFDRGYYIGASSGWRWHPWVSEQAPVIGRDALLYTGPVRLLGTGP